jgi:hypothetical protein
MRQITCGFIGGFRISLRFYRTPGAVVAGRRNRRYLCFAGLCAAFAGPEIGFLSADRQRSRLRQPAAAAAGGQSDGNNAQKRGESAHPLEKKVALSSALKSACPTGSARSVSRLDRPPDRQQLSASPGLGAISAYSAIFVSPSRSVPGLDDIIVFASALACRLDQPRH